MPQPSEYRAIWLWGRQLGSYDYFIKSEQVEAARQNAPIDAIFQRSGKWFCVSDLKEDHEFRRAIENEESVRMITKSKRQPPSLGA